MLNTPSAGQPSLLFDTNNVDWAPSLHLGHGTVPKTSAGRYDRAVQSEIWKQLSDLLNLDAVILPALILNQTREFAWSLVLASTAEACAVRVMPSYTSLSVPWGGPGLRLLENSRQSKGVQSNALLV